MKQTDKNINPAVTNTSTTIDTVKKNVGTHTTVLEILNSNEPSLAAIRRDYGVRNMKTLLVDAVIELLALGGWDLNDVQFKYLMDYISKNYYFLTISDFKAMGKMVMEHKFFGKPTINDCVEIMGGYVDQRLNHAELMSQQNDIEKRKQSDDVEILNEKIREYYARLKTGWKPPEIKKPQTERQKMRDAQKRFINENKNKNDEKKND